MKVSRKQLSKDLSRIVASVYIQSDEVKTNLNIHDEVGRVEASFNKSTFGKHMPLSVMAFDGDRAKALEVFFDEMLEEGK